MKDSISEKPSGTDRVSVLEASQKRCFKAPYPFYSRRLVRPAGPDEPIEVRRSVGA